MIKPAHHLNLLKGTCFKAAVFLCLFGTINVLTAYGAELPYFTGGIESGAQTPWNAGIWWPVANNKPNYFFTDIDGNDALSGGNGSVEFGADYRRLLTNQWAWGTYGFAAYNHSTSGQSFFTVNPGLELLNRAWHFNWNLYLPISSTEQGSGDWVWADSVGIYNYTHFQGHNQYDQLVQMASSTGVGTDLIASYRFKKLANIQASAGIYYFNMDPHAIGYVAMLTSPTIRHASVNVAFTHDPLTSNSVLVGLTLHFGNKKSQDTDWINSAVQHNLPAVSGANTIPIETGYRASGQDQIQNNNVWFFNTTGTAYNSAEGAQNCTYEHPCSGLTSDNLQNITTVSAGSDDPNIYLAPGNYSPSGLILFNNESLMGRSNNYIYPAEGNDRPLLTIDQLLIDAGYGDHINTVENLRLMNNGNGFSAIALVNTEQSTLNNLMIGVSNAAVPSQNYVSGLFLDHSNNVTLNNSTITTNNYLSGSTTDIIGINDLGAANLLIENSNIDTFMNGASSVSTEGLYVSANSSVTLKNSTFNQIANGESVDAINIYSGVGIAAILNTDNSHFNVNVDGNNGSANNMTLQGNSSATINDSTFNTDISSVGSNQLSIGVQLYNQASLIMNNSTIASTAKSTAGESAATNIFLFNNSQLTLNNTDLIATGSSALVTGSTNITAENNAVATINGGQFNVSMSGGPSVGEPSGAVALWAINNATMTVNSAIITATSGNNETGGVALQTENNAVATVNDSTLKNVMQHGNITNADASVVVAGNASNITVNNSHIISDMAGATDRGLVMVESISNSTIHLTNDTLAAYNQMTSLTSQPVLTVGAGAVNTSIIYLNKVGFNLNGEETQNTKTWDGGSVIGD